MLGRTAGLAIPLIIWALSSFAGAYEDGEAAYRSKDYIAAIELWRPLADNQDAQAQARLAEMYLGGLGVVRDYEKALFWSRKAADQGEPRAQYILASMYRDGTGVARDLLRAIALYRQAADQDFHWAQYNLAVVYFTGEGGPPDYVEAYHWVALAANARQEDDEELLSTAAFLLDGVAARLSPDQLRDAKRRISQWKRVPARQ